MDSMLENAEIDRVSVASMDSSLLESATNAFAVRDHVGSSWRTRIDIGNQLNHLGASNFYEDMLNQSSYVFANKVSEVVSRSVLFGDSGPKGLICTVAGRAPIFGPDPCTCRLGLTDFNNLLIYQFRTSTVPQDCRRQ